MTHVTCRLTAKNRDQPRNPTLGSWVCATLFTIALNVGSYAVMLLLCNCNYKTWTSTRFQNSQVQVWVRQNRQEPWLQSKSKKHTYRERKCAENYNKWHNKLIFKTAISILLISNHNSFLVLFDKTASVYFIWKNIFIFQHWKWPAQGTSTVPIVSAHFRALFLQPWCLCVAALNRTLNYRHTNCSISLQICNALKSVALHRPISFHNHTKRYRWRNHCIYGNVQKLNWKMPINTNPTHCWYHNFGKLWNNVQKCQ